jgi:hypothetical protein
MNMVAQPLRGQYSLLMERIMAAPIHLMMEVMIQVIRSAIVAVVVMKDFGAASS